MEFELASTFLVRPDVSVLPYLTGTRLFSTLDDFLEIRVTLVDQTTLILGQPGHVHA